MKRLSALFLLLMLLSISQWIYYFPQLPQKVVSQVSFSGKPTSWMDKSTLLLLNLGITLFLGLIFGVLSVFLKKIPASLWNLPHKEYWLSAERRQWTASYVQQQMLICGCATLIFLMFISQQMIRFNLSGGEALSMGRTVLALVVFVGFIISWSVLMIIKFGKPEARQ